ncbi:hypothetical protein N7539_004320 [Penicillium diatomitis]|uniref:Asl1-like glycosyl hydrolase catalytic domain-containing protein n=1 Tax=Penicillium diatomitis TaxID=2819901 RepID=A0A9X0BY50_9EURO|nr:uncharacterized protein N7539_004320 [Penicillium diatomitis]KAJ5489430.1 hypothetical protein N7539_004320 [Penicillium diatomitis]
MVAFTRLFTTGLLATSAMAAPIVQQRSSSGKRGAAYNDIGTVQPLSAAGTVSWAYNWAMSSWGQALPSNVEYVPMLWGAKDFGGWFAAIETALSSGSNYIMGFNEPDIGSQANMSPAQAAGYYQNYITPFSGKAKLISPAVSSSTNQGMGLSWMNEFLNDCASCGISGMAIHWYGETADQFKSHVSNALTMAASHGISEVWVTEFALNADVGGVTNPANTAAFLADVLPWLDAQPGVSRYSYFMCAENYLVNGNALNQAGQAYIS